MDSVCFDMESPKAEDILSMAANLVLSDPDCANTARVVKHLLEAYQILHYHEKPDSIIIIQIASGVELSYRLAYNEVFPSDEVLFPDAIPMVNAPLKFIRYLGQAIAQRDLYGARQTARYMERKARS